MKNLNQSTTDKSEKDLAQTPEWFIYSLCDLIGIKGFDLDVCSLESTKKAEKCYSLDERGEDGLLLGWGAWNWCNPPFSGSSILEFVGKAHSSAIEGKNTAIIMPNNPETNYVRYAKGWADTIIEMPFRLKFLRPDGSKFLDSKGRESSPQFSCLVAIFTKLGLSRDTAFMYHDFRQGFYGG